MAVGLCTALAIVIVDILIFLLCLSSKLFNNNKYSDQNISVIAAAAAEATAVITIIIMTAHKSRHQEQRLDGKKRLWKGRECVAQTK